MGQQYYDPTAERQVKALNDLLEKSFSGNSLRKMNQNLGQFVGLTNNLNQQLNFTATNGLKVFIKGMEDFVVKGKSFKDILQKMGLDLLTQVTKQFSNVAPFTSNTSQNSMDFFGQLGSAISGVLGVRAKGGAVHGGKSYLVGEAGPEVFVPGRTSGFIVPNQTMTSSNTSSLKVNVINNANARVNVSEKQGQGGTRNLQIQIDEMIANSLAKGTKTRGVLRNVFGVSPALTQR